MICIVLRFSVPTYLLMIFKIMQSYAAGLFISDCAGINRDLTAIAESSGKNLRSNQLQMKAVVISNRHFSP